MKVLIVNTSEKTGGAAIAANRLMEALNRNGVKAKMLVRDKQTDHIMVCAIPSSPLLKFHFLWERLCIWIANRLDKGNLFQLDIANAGTDITRLPEFKEADLIHLHWVNQGFLSLGDIEKILKSGKPVVWTLHDEWPFTGICHYSGTCEQFRTQCHHCPMLAGGGSGNDLSARVWKRKKALFKEGRIVFVACSKWLEGIARQSALLATKKVVSIPNTINASIFHPMLREKVRSEFQLPLEKKLLLFGSLKTTDPRKGIHYLKEACHIIQTTRPELSEKLGIIVVGNRADEIRSLFPFPVYAFNYVDSEKKMAALYNAADAYVTPSLEDNLPNTIVEALSCGIPCVGFNVGGIPEMIVHQKNGYLAEARNAADLSEGICHVLRDDIRDTLSKEALHYATAQYGETQVTHRYIQLYEQLTNQ